MSLKQSYRVETKHDHTDWSSIPERCHLSQKEAIRHRDDIRKWYRDWNKGRSDKTRVWVRIICTEDRIWRPRGRKLSDD